VIEKLQVVYHFTISISSRSMRIRSRDHVYIVVP